MKKIVAFAVIIILIIILVLITTKKKEHKIYDFSIHFFDAGKADAILIKNKDKYIMIDTAEESFSNNILKYFKDNNINELDYLIITHFDKDHVGSAASIIDNIKILNILQSNYPKDSEYYLKYKASLEKNSITPITVEGNMEFSLEEMKIIVDGPTKIYDKNESNNSSLIVKLNYKNTDYLFMGDAENARIKDFLSEESKTYDFIKIPYHGNELKRLPELLIQTNPTYAVITSSLEKKESTSTIKTLKELRIKYYLTRNGSIDLGSDGENIYIYQ